MNRMGDFGAISGIVDEFDAGRITKDTAKAALFALGAEARMVANPPPSNRFSHYFRDVSALQTIDVYRVLLLFGVTDPCLQHAIKKALVAGGRGHKDAAKDVAEAIVSLQRWQQMREEENES